MITVGDGACSIGDYNATDAVFDGDFGKLLTHAAARGKPVAVLPGIYNAKTCGTISYSGIQIVGIGNPEVRIPTTNTSSPAVISIESLNDVKVTGIKFSWDAFVASQVVIAASPSVGTTQLAIAIEENTFTAGNAVASGFVGGTNEMIAVSLTNSAYSVVRRNRFYPSIGLTCVKATDGYGNTVSENIFSAQANIFFPTIGNEGRRPMWRGVHLQDEAGWTVENNKFRNLGLTGYGADYYVSSCVYVDNADVASSTEELGHGIMQNNRIEDCLSSTDCLVVLRGVRWANIVGNWWCFNGVAATRGTGFLKIEGATGKTGEVSYKVSVTGCHFHNPGTTDAAAIYIRRSTSVSIKACDFFELQTKQAIFIDSSADDGGLVNDLAVVGCHFEWFSTAPSVRYVVLRDGSTTALENYAAMANIAYSGAASEVVDSFYNGNAPTGVYTTTKGVMDVSTGIDVATSADTANLRTNIIMIKS